MYKISNAGQTSYQVEDNKGNKSLEFTMDARSTVVIGHKITTRRGTVVAVLTFEGAKAFAIYQNNVVPLDNFAVSFNIH